MVRLHYTWAILWARIVVKSVLMARRPKPEERSRQAVPRFRSWETRDEDEIERRRQRALAETFTIQPLERHLVFGTFRVSSPGKRTYEVEIRSLTGHDNSCGCPDFQVNGLGTCKHVEAVLARGLQGPASRAGRRIEIFLRTTGPQPEVRVQWPSGSGRSQVRQLVAPFFSERGTLRGDPVSALPALVSLLEAAPAKVRDRVRLSRHLLSWLDEQRRRAARGTAREQFLAEVGAGQQTLDVVKHPLYPYQHEGMLHLAFTERALLADEMGLGKTIQAIAACELLRRLRGIERVLVVSPASLKGEWEEQIARFTDLPSLVIEGTRAQRIEQYEQKTFFYLTNYEQILADGPEIQRRLAPDIVILDEAQRIKNWQSRTAAAVKRLQSPYAFVLTGTPIENRIDEVYSIVQFLDPGLLGPLFRFNREFYKLDERGRPAGYKNLRELHRRLSSVLLRRRKSDVEGQLPGRTDTHYFVPMDEEQLSRYEDYQARASRLLAIARRRPLRPQEYDKLQKWLACMRMVCDTPYILDRTCRVCPKLGELLEILREVLADPQSKILVFSEWERMLDLVRDLLQEMGMGFAWHTGSVPQRKRREEIRRFKEDPECRFFLSTDSGGVGLNLQAANVVVNLDLPWNPARLEQRIARAWRKHQTRPVQVLYLITENSIEHRMLPLLAGKQALAEGVLDAAASLEEMALPSGRAALVERLETLFESPPRESAPVEESGATPPSVPFPESIDRATIEAIERLAAAGLLQLTDEGRRLLDQSATPVPESEQTRRLRQARAVLAQAERKVRMASVLDSGGFSVEALPALREGLELSLRSWAHCLETDNLRADSLLEEDVPLPWIQTHLPDHLSLVESLRSAPQAPLVEEKDARRWIRDAMLLAERIDREMGAS